jgi:hypothetical protein
MILRILALILFFTVISCSPRGHIIRINKSEIAPYTHLDLNQRILVNIPQNISQKDYYILMESALLSVQQRGFLEVWDTDEYELELRAAEIADFSLERNIQRLYDNLGVNYFLDIVMISRKPFRYSSLSSQLEYREQMNPNFPNFGGLVSETDHRVITQYTLYQTDGVIKMAEFEVESSHLKNNTLDARVIRREIQEFFNQIYLAVP